MAIAAWSITFVAEDWPGFDQILELDYRELYESFGVPRELDWYHDEYPSIHVVAHAGPNVLGAGRLLGAPGERARQLRQVVVTASLRGEGIGTALVEAMERRAACEGARQTWLNARDTAFEFYEKLGYEYDGEMFVSALTGIPHRRMRKELGPPPA